MNRLLSIDPAVLKRLRGLKTTERAECLLALCDMVEVFGQPHVHGGVGVRKLGDKLFECRAGLSLRFLFHRGSELYVVYLGSHDEVATLLRRGRYR